MKTKEKDTCLTAASRVERILGVLPAKLAREIAALGALRRDYPEGLSEIRVRSEARSSLTLSGENIPLFSRVGAGEMARLYDRLLSGSLYAHTSDLSSGFLSAPSGVRIGISAARSDSGDLPSEVTGLCFRIPTMPSEAADDIYRAFMESRGGVLNYSLPGGGKTSALRALAGMISREGGMRVAVIDERREFIREDYRDTTVDIMTGYRKERGIEIALRALSPEVIIIDEIGSLAETEALVRVGRGGLPVIATAHARDRDELLSKASIAPLVERGYFSTLVRLYRDGSAHRREIERIGTCCTSV